MPFVPQSLGQFAHLHPIDIPPHSLDHCPLFYYPITQNEGQVHIDARHLPIPELLARCTHRDAPGLVFEITAITTYEKPQRDSLDHPYTHTLTLTALPPE